MSAGDWWDESWTPLVGCDMSLPCAERCWARRFAHRLKSNPKTAKKYKGLTDATGRWTGEVRLDERELERPLHWCNPRVAAVSLMGDIFLAPDQVLDRVYAVMALCPQHRFVVLTKRAERRQDYLSRLARSIKPLEDIARQIGYTFNFDDIPLLPWPILNIIEMISVSTQAELDERWPWLAKTPAEKRGLHIEPMIGPVDLYLGRLYGVPREHDGPLDLHRMKDRLDWVVCGAETGPGARPMHPDWARDLRDQCAAGGIPFLFKGWGEWAPLDQIAPRLRHQAILGTVNGPAFHRWPDGEGSHCVGRGIAGRLLDGREHNGLGWA